MQWGTTSNAGASSKANFSRTFTSIYNVVATLNNSLDSGNNFDDNVTFTTTSVTFNYGKHYYLAIGIS